MNLELNHTAIETVLEDGREEALIHYASRLVVYAQMLCPVGLTGHLRRSIERGDLENGARQIWVVAMAAYSIFVERGTGIYAAEGNGRKTPWTYRTPDGRFYTTEGMEPQPFMWEALQMLAMDAA